MYCILDFFLIMATFGDDYQDIFGESCDEDFEELDFNYDIEVEVYSEIELEDSESEDSVGLSESENEGEAMQQTGRKH